MLAKLDAEKQIYRCHEMKLLLLLQKDLVEFVSMIEHGPDIKSQIENGLAKSDFAIAQLLYFNSHKKGTKNTSEHSRHSRDREPPFVLSTADVNKPFCKMAGQTTPSSIN
jgi:hypothetical protein